MMKAILKLILALNFLLAGVGELWALDCSFEILATNSENRTYRFEMQADEYLPLPAAVWTINGEEKAETDRLHYAFLAAGTYEICANISAGFQCTEAVEDCVTLEFDENWDELAGVNQNLNFFYHSGNYFSFDGDTLNTNIAWSFSSNSDFAYEGLEVDVPMWNECSNSSATVTMMYYSNVIDDFASITYDFISLEACDCHSYFFDYLTDPLLVHIAAPTLLTAYDSVGNQILIPVGSETKFLCAGAYQFCTFFEEEFCLYDECIKIEIPDIQLNVEEEEGEWTVRINNHAAIWQISFGSDWLNWSINGNSLPSDEEFLYENFSVEFATYNSEQIYTVCLEYDLDDCINEVCTDLQFLCQPEVYLNTNNDIHQFTHSQDWEGNYHWEINGIYAGEAEVLELPEDSINDSTSICAFYEAYGDDDFYKCSAYGCFFFDACDLFSVEAVETSDGNAIYFTSLSSNTSVSYTLNGTEVGPTEMPTGYFSDSVSPGFYSVCAVFTDSISVIPACETEICEEIVVYGNCSAGVEINYTLDGSLASITAYPWYDVPPWIGSDPWEQYYYEFVYVWFIDGEFQQQTNSQSGVFEYDFADPFGTKEVCVILGNWECQRMTCETIEFPCPFDCGEAQLVQSLNDDSLHLEIDFSELVCTYTEEADWWINGNYWGTASALDYVFPMADAFDISVQYYNEFNCVGELYQSIIYTQNEECFRGISYEYCGSVFTFQVEGGFNDSYEIGWKVNGVDWPENTWDVSSVFDDAIYEICLEIHSGSCYFQECIAVEEPVPDECNLFIEIDQSEIIHAFSINSASEPEFAESVVWTLDDDFIGSGNFIEYEMEEDGVYKICAEFSEDISECSDVCRCEIFTVELGCDFELIHEEFWGMNIFEVSSEWLNNVTWTINDDQIHYGPAIEFSFQEIGEYEVCAIPNCTQYIKCETVIVEEFLDCSFSISSQQEEDLLMHFSANTNTFPFETGFSEWTINGEPEGWGFNFTHEFEEFGSYEICFNYEGLAACDFQECNNYLIEELDESGDCYLHVFVDQLGFEVELSFLSSQSLAQSYWTLNGAPLENNDPSYVEDQPGLYQACLQAEDINGCTAESCVTFQVFEEYDFCEIDIQYENLGLDYEFWIETFNIVGEQEFIWFNDFMQEIGYSDTIQYTLPNDADQLICVEYYSEDPLCGSHFYCENISIYAGCGANIGYDIVDNAVELEVNIPIIEAIIGVNWTVNGEYLSDNTYVLYEFPGSGQYEFEVQVFGANGCSSIVELILDFEYCDFEIQWEANGNQHLFSFELTNPITVTGVEWTIDGNAVSSNSNLEVSLDSPGFYAICLNIESNDYCQLSKCLEIEVADELDGGENCPSIPAVLMEENGTVHLSANYLPTYDLEVYWDYGSGEILNGDVHELSDLDPGNYSFCFYYFSPDCSSTNCVNATIYDPLCLFDIEFENDLLNGVLSAEGFAVENYEIEWMIADDVIEGSSISYSFDDFGQWVVCATTTDGEGNECEQCQFVLVEDPSGDNCAVYFDVLLEENSLLVGAQPLGVLAEDLEYSWDFGDGAIGSGQNFSHVYSEAGEYEVCVELETELESCSDITCQFIIVESLVFDLVGIVTTGDLDDDELVEAIVYLYQYDDESEMYEFIDTAHTQSTQFEFSSLNKESEYILKAVLKESSPLSQNHAPTYFDKAVYWSNAQHIDFNSSELIVQLESLEPTVGDGFIEGQLINQLEGESIEGALVFLTDAAGNAIAYTYTDEFGYFSFDDLAEGSYLLFADVVNIESDIVLIKIKPENLTNHFVDLIFTGERIEGTTASAIQEYHLSNFEIFPNPFEKSLSIKWHSGEEIEQVEIFDLHANCIFRHSMRGSETSFQLANLNWSPGIYFLKLSIQGEASVLKKIIKH